MDGQVGVDVWQAWVIRLEAVHWLTLATAVAFLVLIAVLVVQSRSSLRKQERVRELVGGGAPKPVEIDPQAALKGTALSPIDRVLPRRPAAFMALVVLVSAGSWALGLMLANDVSRFLASEEWRFQPLYIAAHVIALRLFINVFARNFAAGANRLQMSTRHALQGVRAILGGWGVLAAVVLAAPFCWSDYNYLITRYEATGRGGVIATVDYLMFGIWCLEWFINAFIWVLLVGFMVKNCVTIKRYPFKAPVNVVLQEKHYRPFLQMSAQGSTVVLGFSLITVLYIYFTEGALTDYMGLAITLVLLIVCFVPPWLLLRDKVEDCYRAELSALHQIAGLRDGVPGAAGATRDRSLEERMDEIATMLRIWHLQTLYGSLGHSEATAIMVRLLPPALTIGWQAFQHYGSLMERVGRMMAGGG